MDITDRPVAWAHAAPAAQAAPADCDAQVVRLADGAPVSLRLASAVGADDAALRRLFFTLSDTTRYLYFCAGVPATATWAERFVALGSPGSLGHTDSDGAYVLVAEVGNELVGFARFSPQFSPRAGTAPQVMDLGIVLTDAWQGRGLGGHLLCRLAAAAHARGVASFSAVVLWENRRMLPLARRLFPDVHADCASGACELTMDLASWWAQQQRVASSAGRRERDG